jgi:hypothetical protein
MKNILEKKYGQFVTSKLLCSKTEVLLNNINKSGIIEQQEVLNHLKSIRDIENNPLIPSKFFQNNVKWGFDFSGWIGSLQSESKEFMLIGAEPNINHNYQIVYDFGTEKGVNIYETALKHYNTKWTKTTRDIWGIMVDMFSEYNDNDSVVEFLSKCYMTDLCHFVPQGCSNIEAISKKLGVTKTEWKSLRSKSAQLFLKDEILTLSPKVIVLHGEAARSFFIKEFKQVVLKNYKIENSNFTISEGEWNNIKVIGIPHLSGDVRNKLWRCRKFEERAESARNIIQKILASSQHKNRLALKETTNPPSYKKLDIIKKQINSATKYIDLDQVTSHLSKLGSSLSQKELSLKMLDDLKREYYVKPTKSGFTLYAPKSTGKGEQLFANFYVKKDDYFEVRFLYHGSIQHANVKEYAEMKDGKLAYLLNQYITTTPFKYDNIIKQLTHDAYDVIHEGRHRKVKDDYRKRYNLK